jgi:hypothetical protein
MSTHGKDEPLLFGASLLTCYYVGHPWAWPGSRKWLAGTFAEKQPVAPLPGETASGGACMIRIQKILYATDFSSYSNQAYFHAVALASTHGASLTVLFVYTPDMVTPGQPAGEAETLKYWRSQLEQIRPVDPRIPVQHILLEGDPGRDRSLWSGCWYGPHRHGDAWPHRPGATAHGQRGGKGFAGCFVLGAGREIAQRRAVV